MFFIPKSMFLILTTMVEYIWQREWNMRKIDLDRKKPRI